MGYLFAAYFVFWAVTFGYILTLGSRARKLERQIADLTEESQEGQITSAGYES